MCAGTGAGILSRTRKFICKSAFHKKGYPLSGAETVFGQVFGKEGMTEISQRKVPPTPGGQRVANRLLNWARRRSPLLIRGLIARLRCAAPCQSRCRATWPPSRYPCPSQAAFAPCVRSCCLSSAGRVSICEAEVGSRKTAVHCRETAGSLAVVLERAHAVALSAPGRSHLQHFTVFSPYKERPTGRFKDVSETRYSARSCVPRKTPCLPLDVSGDDALQCTALCLH
jgi:hypothetical protein